MRNESETMEQVFERCTSTDFSSCDREEILKAMQEYADLQVKDYKIAQEGNLRRLDELNEWKRSAIEVHKPLYDYMQGPSGEALGLRIGDSIIQKTVELLKEFESLGKKLK